MMNEIDTKKLNKAITPKVYQIALKIEEKRKIAIDLRNKVDEIYKKILKEIPLYTDTNMVGGKRKRIYSHDKLILADDDKSFAKVIQQVSDESRKQGIKPDDMKDDYCPALVARQEVIEAQWELIAETGEILGIENNELLSLGMKKYQKWIDLVIKAAKLKYGKK